MGHRVAFRWFSGLFHGDLHRPYWSHRGLNISNGVTRVLLGTLGSFGGLGGPRVAQRNSNGSKYIQVRHREFQGGRGSNGSKGVPRGPRGF